MIKSGFFLAFFAFFLLSCTGKEGGKVQVVDEQLSEEEQKQQIFDEVMGLHDELMPRMQDLFDLRTEIITKADSLEGIGIQTDDLRQTIIQLEESEEAMMDWMRNFQSLPSEIPHDSVMNYMTVQREKIMEVKKKITEALEAGKSASGR